MSAPALMLLAWAIEAAFGWPNWLYTRIAHPVVWLGGLISWFDRQLNQTEWSHAIRYGAGMITSLVTIGVFTGAIWLLAYALPSSLWGLALEALIASSLIASRSLYAHVASVARPLCNDDLAGARQALSQIVGRDPNQLDKAGIARAGLESLAENASDGIVAPIFWGAIFGLPGLAAYKAINTLDSMIGHRNERYGTFGGFAARLDDLANWVPARLTGGLIVLASLKTGALKTMLQDAYEHRSPNAGWPEAAMAGALGIRLSGPRTYGAQTSQDPWLNADARDPEGEDMQRGLTLYQRAMLLGALILLGLAIGLAR